MKRMGGWLSAKAPAAIHGSASKSLTAVDEPVARMFWRDAHALRVCCLTTSSARGIGGGGTHNERW